mmetsp:Transcript_64467/g.153885  ORF Transcript_64467/g.153885 Transcript_64467/m.153885 type:complete len:191 (-) Transcript_64467:27-599(-)
MSHSVAGIHAISHTVAAESSGRGISIVMDPWWRLGKEHGSPMVPVHHPVFSRKDYKARHYKMLKPAQGDAVPAMTEKLTEACTFRLPAGGRAVIHPQVERPAPSPTRRAKSAGCLFASTASAVVVAQRRRAMPAPQAEPVGTWGTRSTCSAFEGWSNNLPLTHYGKGAHVLKAKPVKAFSFQLPKAEPST